MRSLAEVVGVASEQRVPNVRVESRSASWWLAITKRASPPEPSTAVHGVELIYLCVLAAFIVFGWVGLLLGELGYFSLGALALLALPLLAGAIFAFRQTWRSFSIAWSWDIAGALPALVLAVVLFTPPFEYTIGGADPGVYVSTGANIARTGSILIVDKDLAVLPPLRNVVAGFDERMTGFYIADRERGLLQPHGLHLYPTMLAIGHALGGIYANLWVTTAITLLGLSGFYLLARRLLGGMTALIAAVLLVVNPAVDWFARYPAAENLVQLWLFGGLLAFVLMLDTGNRWLAVLAGLAFGAVHLTKIEEVVLPVALGGFFAYQWLTHRWRKEYNYFLAAYGVIALHAALHAKFFADIYTFFNLTMALRGLSRYHLVILTGLLMCAVVALLALRKWVAQILASPLWTRIGLPSAVCAILSLGVYAYYLRPRIGGQPANLFTLAPAELYAFMSRLNFIILGWYVSPVGLLLGVVGYATVLVRRRSTRIAVLLLFVLAETLLFQWESHIKPVHFWEERRSIPIIFPAFALFGAYLIWQLTLSLRGRWPESLVPIALGLVVVLHGFDGWAPFRGHVEFQGAIEQTRSLSKLLPEQGIALFDNSHASLILATPLQYVWERSSYVPSQEANRSGLTQRMIAELLAQGREVYWVHSASESLPQAKDTYLVQTGDTPDLDRWGYSKTLVGEQYIDLPMMLPTIDRRPDIVERMKFTLQVFRILPQ